MSSPTPNKGMTYPAHGGAVNAWDSPLNTDFDQLDLNLGGYYPITVQSTIAGATFNSSYATISSTVTTATPPSSIAQNVIYKFVTGASTTTMSNLTFTMPAVGSFYFFDNQSSGAGTITINTAAVGSSGKTIAQGGNNLIYTDGTDAHYAPQNVQAKLYGYSGNPTQNVSGTAASVNGGFNDVIWDFINWQLYPCTTTGAAATAVYTPVLNRIVPQGYLTLSTDATNPILTADQTAVSTVYYTPFMGNWTVLSNGTVLYPYQFSQMSLTLTAGAHAASNIYDVFMYANPTSGVIAPVIGTGPAWSNSGAGTGSRGTGAGTSELQRFGGILTNKNAVTLTNGASTYSCAANQGIYLGSIFIDSTAGKISCYLSFGQSRKWGVWNYFNRQVIVLQAGDSTASWTYGGGVYRASNNDSNNKLTPFCGAAEEFVRCTFQQFVSPADKTVKLAIGANVTNAASGTIAVLSGGSVGVGTMDFTGEANYTLAPTLGINNIQSLEFGSAGTPGFNGTQTNMLLSAWWRG